MIYYLDFILSKTLLIFIKLYQHTLSPDHGIASYYTIGVCRSRPTCSEFAYSEISRLGIRATPSVFTRVKDCHP